MSKDVIIIGAGGHAKVIADIVLCSGDNLIGFLDDDARMQGMEVFKGYKVIGKISDYSQYSDKYFVVAVGDNRTRVKIVEDHDNLKWYTAIHPDAVISDTAKIGEGSVVMAGAVINPDTIIGKHCVINTSCSIDHDNKIGDFVHISPGAHLAGTVLVGDMSWICAGAIVINNINITENVVIGAGAVVVSDLEKSGVYVGVPVKRIKQAVF